jgi:aspartyl-tRNA(Asn)/glutamyl-tRNA(Gln) amidotransferase subunit C
MQFTRETVQHLADLARIRLSDSELDQMAQELHAITDAIDSIQEIAQTDIEPTINSIPLVNAMRSDIPEPALSVDLILSSAPASEDHKFKSPKILGEE